MLHEVEGYHHLLPAGAPPLLTNEQIANLCSRGWLDLDLPEGLSDSIDELQATAAAFFGQTTEEKVNTLELRHVEEEGYYHVADEKEYVTFRREIASSFALQDKVKDIWPQIAALLHRMLCDLSRAGGLDIAAWDQIINNALRFPSVDTSLRNSTTLLRVFRYEPGTGTADRHTDLGLLTLCVGTGAGLEVLDPLSENAEWKPSAKCTVLVGETLRSLASNNIYPGVHRVTPNPAGRQSFVFALRPDLSKTVDLEQFGGRGMVDMRTLFTSIKGSKYNVNSKHEDRERQKNGQAARKANHNKQLSEEDQCSHGGANNI